MAFKPAFLQFAKQLQELALVLEEYLKTMLHIYLSDK